MGFESHTGYNGSIVQRIEFGFPKSKIWVRFPLGPHRFFIVINFYYISTMKLKLKNIILALNEQGPLKRFFRNFFITGNAWGMFHKNSHFRADTGEAKIMYNTKKTANKAAENMEKKYDKHFSVYKCIFCDGYHIGKNRDNKEKHEN